MDQKVNILLLRGLVRERRHWMGFDSFLESKFPNARVFSLDLPGMGTEWGRPCPHSVENIMEDLRRRWLSINAEGGENPWILISLSLGSMTGLKWVECYPKDFKKIVIINSSASNLSAPYKRLNLKMIPRFLQLLLQKDIVERERHIIEFTTSLQKDIEGLAKTWALWATEKPLAFRVLVNQLYAAAVFRAPDKIPIPILVLVSEGDKLAHPSCSRLLAERYKAPLESHISAGHDLCLDAPEWVAEKLGKFV